MCKREGTCGDNCVFEVDWMLRYFLLLFKIVQGNLNMLKGGIQYDVCWKPLCSWLVSCSPWFLGLENLSGNLWLDIYYSIYNFISGNVTNMKCELVSIRYVVASSKPSKSWCYNMDTWLSEWL